MHRADAIGKKIDNLLGGIGDAGLPHGFGRRTEIIGDLHKPAGQLRTREADGAF